MDLIINFRFALKTEVLISCGKEKLMEIKKMVCKECGRVFVGDVEIYNFVCFSCKMKKERLTIPAKAPPAKGKKRRYVYNAKGKIAAEKNKNISSRKQKRNDIKNELLNLGNHSNFNENGQGGNHFPQTKTRDVVGIETLIQMKAAEGNPIAQQLEKLLTELNFDEKNKQED
jgi:hypothetical protein